MATTASADRSIDVVRRFNETVFNGRDYDRIGEFQHPDYVQHGPMDGMEIRGTAESLRTMKLFHGAFSDLRATEVVSFSDGEYVCTHYTYRGTHDGDFVGVPATDERAEIRGTVVNRIADGKIAETWVVADFRGLLQQVGVVPPMDDLAA